MKVTVKYKKKQPIVYDNIKMVENKTLYHSNDYLHLKEKEDRHDGIFIPMADIYGFKIELEANE